MGHSYLPIDCVSNFTRQLLWNRKPIFCISSHQFGIHQSKPKIFADWNEKENSLLFITSVKYVVIIYIISIIIIR